MRLVTFGCSNTAGEGLDDAITTGNPGQLDSQVCLPGLNC